VVGNEIGERERLGQVQVRIREVGGREVFGFGIPAQIVALAIARHPGHGRPVVNVDPRTPIRVRDDDV